MDQRLGRSIRISVLFIGATCYNSTGAAAIGMTSVCLSVTLVDCDRVVQQRVEIST